MELIKNKYRINSPRLNGWDYSNPWWYYITINTDNHKYFLGNVVDGKMVLNELGKAVNDSWLAIPQHHKNVEIDIYVIMPNHVHGIIFLNNISKDVACNVSTNKMSIISPKQNSLSTVVRSFKSAVTKKIRENGYNNFSWQTRFYDRVIRNEKELYQIRKYILENPLKWDIEKNNHDNLEI